MIIQTIKKDSMPEYPCWLWLPECEEWQYYTKEMEAPYVLAVFSHWSKGGIPQQPDNIS